MPPLNGNGAQKLIQLIGPFWQLLAIGGAILSVIVWGVSLRNTIESNHAAVIKNESAIRALDGRINILEADLHGRVSTRELVEAIQSGRERNRGQDERIAELMRRVEHLEQQHRHLSPR